MLNTIQELKSRSDKPIFVVTSSSLCNVPGVVKDNINVEPAVTARLEGIEKMVENLTKGFKELQTARNSNLWPQLQVTAPQGTPPTQKANNVKSGANNLVPQNSEPRSRSSSRKRAFAETEQQEGGTSESQQGDQQWTDVVKKNQNRKSRPPRPHQVGTSKVDIVGGEAAPFSIVIGNTHPDSTDDIISAVLKKVSEQAPSEVKPSKPLEILEVECLTKPREDGRRIWSRTWRVQVPDIFKEYMLKPEAYPAGWTCRKYFPPRPAKQPTPELDPTAGQPPTKKLNREEPPHSHA